VSGQIELRRERVDIGAAVRRALEPHEQAIADKRQKLHVDLPAASCFVEGEPVRIEQVVGNLLQNASKYTAAGGEIRVGVSCTDESAREVVIRIRDNGIGIEPDKLPRVFDLFVRGAPAGDRQYGGLGIGLTLVKRLVELHGGRVEARSSGAGKGSEFIVRLPRLEAAPQKA
jgi:signal transduction histidine kinase